MRDRPAELTPVAAESTRYIPPGLLDELLQARGSRCRRCRTRSSGLTRKRRQGHGRQVPRWPRRIVAVSAFNFDIVGAEKASKVASSVEPARCLNARACLRASEAANEQCI